MAQNLTSIIVSLCIVVLGVMTSLVTSASIEKDNGFDAYPPIKPMMSWKDMDPIDTCLFACNMCYKSVSLFCLYTFLFRVRDLP